MEWSIQIKIDGAENSTKVMSSETSSAHPQEMISTKPGTPLSLALGEDVLCNSTGIDSSGDENQARQLCK